MCAFASTGRSTTNLPQLEKNEKHDIDVVIDRLKVRADMQQRLAESFEAALRIGGPAAASGAGDGRRQEHLFSAKFACPVCTTRCRAGAAPVLLQLAHGRLPSCDGLGNSECSTRSAWWPSRR
jgi:excinuclease ABC subunit A